jgi:hypothetical protein
MPAWHHAVARSPSSHRIMQLATEGRRADRGGACSRAGEDTTGGGISSLRSDKDSAAEQGVSPPITPSGLGPAKNTAVIADELDVPESREGAHAAGISGWLVVEVSGASSTARACIRKSPGSSAGAVGRAPPS